MKWWRREGGPFAFLSGLLISAAAVSDVSGRVTQQHSVLVEVLRKASHRVQHELFITFLGDAGNVTQRVILSDVYLLFGQCKCALPLSGQSVHELVYKTLKRRRTTNQAE